MNLRGLDLNLLVILDALLTEQHVTRAGERINLSQSATSDALAKLRNFFGDQLLIKDGRQMVMTPLAKNLAVSVREALLYIQGSIATKAEFNPATSDHIFKIMASDYMLTILMPKALQYLKENAPHVKLDVREISNSYLEELKRGEFDLIIHPFYYAIGGYPKEVFYEDSFSCAVWTGNKLVGDTISIDEYLELGHITVRFGKDRLPGYEEFHLIQHGFKRHVEITAPLYTLIPTFLMGTNRIAALPTTLARYYATHLPIRVIPFPTELPPFVEVLQWNKFSNNDPGTNWLRGVLQIIINEILTHSASAK
jgi:DNA-binding transcriptional LysR family regulator